MGKMEMLVLGGTRFLGPEVVRAALARGHAVTLFNRGKSDPRAFPGLLTLRGDRNGDVSALNDRRFDTVVDTSAYVPAHVARVALALRGQVGHYTLVSSVSVYSSFGKSRDALTEDSPVATLSDEATEEVTGETYGALKALCERKAEAAWPGRTAAVRPGLIVGPGDPTDRFTFWPVRVARGGEVLAPGDGSAELQVVDVRDLAAWIVTLAETGTAGVFNAVGYARPVSFGEMLAEARLAAGGDASFAWVPALFLAEKGVEAWHQLPAWLSPEVQAHVANERAVGRGLTFRSVGRTIADTLEWVQATGRRPAWGVGAVPGLSLEREAALLQEWRGRDTPR